MGNSANEAHVLRHPQLDEDYFAEAHHAHAYWARFITKSMLYDEFFTPQVSAAVEDFYRGLIAASPGQPVFQECRTTGRMTALKASLGGRHIYLLRDPWDQWWSSKINYYFDITVQLVLNAEPHPGIVALIRDRNGFVPFHSPDIGAEFEYFRQRPMSPEQSYRAFFALWAFALLQAMSSADLIIDVDRLSTSQEYRTTTVDRLAAMGLDHISFDDCQTPSLPFNEEERAYYERIEAEIFDALLADGADGRRIRLIQALLARRRNASKAALTRESLGLTQARAIVVRYADELHWTANRMHESLHALEAAARTNTDLAAAAECARADFESRILSLKEAAQNEIELRIEAQQQATAYEARLMEQQSLARDMERVFRAELTSRDEVVAGLQVKISSLDESLASIEARIAAMRNSISWRLTGPLRFARRRLRRLFASR